MKAIGPLKSALSPAKPGPRKRYGFSLHHAPRGQMAVIKWPQLQDQLLAERKEMAVQVADRLITRGFSQNHAAVLLGLAPSRLHYWRAAYKAGGIAALAPKRRKRTAKASAADSPIRLEFILAR